METQATYEERIDRLLNEWKTQLHLYDAKLHGLKFQMDKLDNKSRGDLLKRVTVLEEKIAKAKTKLEEGRNRLENLKETREEAWDDLKSGGQMAWEELKAGVENAWEEMKTAFDTASTRLSDKKNSR
jgi:chromosome segregation ATPase